MSKPPLSGIKEELADLEQQALLRRLRTVKPVGMEGGLELDGRQVEGFSSNDYLGLARHPVLREAAARAADRYGCGAGASRLVCGSLPVHRELEERLAEFKGSEAALTFSSGYAAALGCISAVVGQGDVVILDKLAHASLIDGARLSGAHLRVFPHNNLEKLSSHLEWAARRHSGARVLVVTESVFSMDGDRAAVADIVRLKEDAGALLLVDEAHATGVLGRGGRGLCELAGVSGAVDLQLGTLSKALGAAGGYVCASRPLVDLMINRARSFVYSTAPPPPVAAAALAGLELLGGDEGSRLLRRLHENCLEMERAGFGPVQSAIVPVAMGEACHALWAADQLLRAGFFVPAIRYPTVPRGSARLRVTLSACHESSRVQALCTELKGLGPAGAD
jgi:8-amino-7-oxononanoate synthase